MIIPIPISETLFELPNINIFSNNQLTLSFIQIVFKIPNIFFLIITILSIALFDSQIVLPFKMFIFINIESIFMEFAFHDMSNINTSCLIFLWLIIGILSYIGKSDLFSLIVPQVRPISKYQSFVHPIIGYKLFLIYPEVIIKIIDV